MKTLMLRFPGLAELLAAAFYFLSVVLLGGCSTVPAKPITPDGPVIALNAQPLGGTPVVKQPVARRNEVYFTTASDIVTNDSVVTMRRVARFLRNHPGVSVLLEGNCDERGSYAYNQQLGARRAENVAKVLIDNGVAPRQVSTGSNGEFKPLAVCHKEACWGMNRRVDVIYGGW